LSTFQSIIDSLQEEQQAIHDNLNLLEPSDLDDEERAFKEGVLEGLEQALKLLRLTVEN
jgi:hypothetical protein